MISTSKLDVVSGLTDPSADHIIMLYHVVFATDIASKHTPTHTGSNSAYCIYTHTRLNSHMHQFCVWSPGQLALCAKSAKSSID